MSNPAFPQAIPTNYESSFKLWVHEQDNHEQDIKQRDNDSREYLTTVGQVNKKKGKKKQPQSNESIYRHAAETTL